MPVVKAFESLANDRPVIHIIKIVLLTTFSKVISAASKTAFIFSITCFVSVKADDSAQEIDDINVSSAKLCDLPKSSKAIIVVFNKKDFDVFPAEITEMMLC